MRLSAGLLLSVLCSALVLGCGDACKEGLRTKKNIETLDLKLGQAVNSPVLLDETCPWLEEKGYKNIRKASRYANQTAEFVFSERYTRCAAGYYERRCRTRRDRKGRRYRDCWRQWRCTYYETRVTRLDGYETAKSLHRHLNTAGDELAFACHLHEQGDQDRALGQIADTHALIRGPITEKGISVLRRTGCLERNLSLSE